MERPDPADYRPRLTPAGHAWRVLGMVAISAVAGGPITWEQLQSSSDRGVVSVALGLGAFVLACYRRRWPLPIAVVTAALGGVSALAAGPAVLAAVSLATSRRLVPIVVVGVVAIASGQSLATIEDGNGSAIWLTLVANTIFVAGILGSGMYIGSRRELLWTLSQRGDRAEAEQSLRVAQARATERARIAREMHDVLAHRISRISLHAGVLTHRDDLTPEALRTSAEVIQEKAHEALVDLRGVLGVLRDPGTGALLEAPQPRWADLSDLVAEGVAGRQEIAYDDRVTGSEPVPDPTARTVYRIVQEGLTNARKHAFGARLTIELSGSPDEGISVLLCNPLGFAPPTTPGSGLGLIGLAERVELSGGRLEHRVRDGAFELECWLPWSA